ncbi:ISL3-like element ISAtc2 family transposase [Acidithiobacillus caldus]|uniref:ISAtfe-like protein n=5 Tax=Acidithiobacillus caldus TaxID=33059 RepID=F9ZNM7_ACICS|nr:ISL3-like element ISAtc2 family transposase [Acidithiobacillus caldus]AEK57550.1 ISAtfe-like protein [Acidithiobacillus caldus SM-1]AEK57680.1 ISAtfe-like protein [Acidithiobacillus caldus SM-1]AEK57787.1 ISAtfe-like protein [Acidithiobacillus caldus SM-1]AEK58176.1 ISAtfe-like protein [Acidithiobacillus caldus SM-1]AEK58218.1 ISAtfe-like protein [Acidithiobacillus caldus SM-1]
MDQGNQLFTLALGLVPPWAVDAVRFTVEEKRLDLYVNFSRGSHFPCPVCGQDCPVHDTQEKVWRHLDFFQHAAYLHARVPRVQCPEHGVHLVPVPWAREGSGFTLLFEALVMAMVREMPVLTVSRLVRETDQRLWRVIDHYVSKAREAVDMSEVQAIGVDETNSRRGHDYISLFVDLAAKRLLFATPGKDAQTFEKFCEDLQAHGGNSEAIAEVSMDLSPAFQKGAAEHLPNAQVTFDRFHLMKLINEAVDVVRKGEVYSQPDLKKSRWLWLKNPGKLSAKQSAKLQELLKNQNLKTAQAYQFRLTFQEIFTIQNRHQGAVLLKAWMENAKASGLPPLVKVTYTLMNHWDGILRWFESQITNGILEGFNSLLQSAKAKARGYRTHKNFINMAYLILGKLDLRLPT